MRTEMRTVVNIGAGLEMRLDEPGVVMEMRM